MKQIIFEVETITPMFLSGAEQGKAELRAASIKGLMRFWWRALQAESDVKTLRKKEAEIFGSSEEGLGCSKFAIRVTQPDRKSLPDLKKEVPDANDPVRYLFYSAVMNKRSYFPAGSRFRITLSAAPKNNKSLEIAIASLWPTVYLGGVGTRCRRGAGNMVVTAMNDTEGVLTDMKLDFMAKGGNSKEVAEWLTYNFNIAKQHVIDKSGFASEYSNVGFSRFVICDSQFSSWKAALKEIGGIYKEFRREKRIIDRAVLGLPLKNVSVKANDRVDRRSSPLIFKIIKSNGKYYWLVLRLTGEFLPQGSIISAGKGVSRKPDYGIIDEFWSEMKGKGREHILSTPDTLKHLADDIKNQIDTKRIILFGSKARGDFHRHSDTDIAVDTEEPLSGSVINGALDMVNIRTADEKLKSRIKKEGVVIYERKS